MKFVRAVLIILLILIAVMSFNKYTEKRTAQKERQELLNSFINDSSKNDLLKDDLSPKGNQGDIDISPIPLKPDTDQNKKEQPQESSSVQLKNCDVIGRIKINKINVDYAILEETTEETLNLSITRFVGNEVNRPGNLVLAGHNMKDGSLFGRLKELAKGDNIEIYDRAGTARKYQVYKIYKVEPTDLEPLDQETEGQCIVTLLTCTNHSKQRLIVKCK